MIAACLCFRDSAMFLHEWLLFHLVQGVERFYLYDNESADDYQAVLAPWISRGFVELARWPGLAQQQAIYDHCLGHVAGDVEWLAFLDDDEFLFATDGAALPGALRPYEGHAGIAVAWMLYGSAGYERRPEGWVIDTYAQRAPNPDPHVKCIVRPRRVVRSRVIGHAFVAAEGFQVVDEMHRPLAEPLSPQPSVDRLRINHYLMKSWEEFIPRRLRPQANTGAPKPHSLAEWREWDRWWCAIEDPVARRYVPAMRVAEARLFGRA